MITADGWLDWAIKMPGRPATGDGFNAGVNPVKGIVFHSAEGWASTLLSPTSQWGYYSAQYPWHLSNLLDGRLVQHYAFSVRCWHGSAFNQDYVGMEHEGLTPKGAAKGPVLNDRQIANAARVVADLATWKGWTPRRPAQAGDKTATLYEHRETVWFGGTSTSCPNGRIPWAEILNLVDGPSEEEAMKRHNWIATRFDDNRQGAGRLVLRLQDLGLEPGVKQVRLDVYKRTEGYIEVRDGEGERFAFNLEDGETHQLGDVVPSAAGEIVIDVRPGAHLRRVGVVGVWP